jgi:hypothetical protein
VCTNLLLLGNECIRALTPYAIRALERGATRVISASPRMGAELPEHHTVPIFSGLTGFGSRWRCNLNRAEMTC